MTTILTILNHDDETTETLTLAQFIKKFNTDQLSSTIHSIISISYPTHDDKAIASQTFTHSDTIETRNGEKTFDPTTAKWS